MDALLSPFEHRVGLGKRFVTGMRYDFANGVEGREGKELETKDDEGWESLTPRSCKPSRVLFACVPAMSTLTKPLLDIQEAVQVH